MISSVHTRGNTRARFSFKANQEPTREDFAATILRISGVLNSSVLSIVEMVNGSTWMLQLYSLSAFGQCVLKVFMQALCFVCINKRGFDLMFLPDILTQ